MGKSNRGSSWMGAVGALVLTLPATAASTHPAPVAGAAPVFSNSAIAGGGFISVIGRAPDGTLVAGGDTQGFFRSVDDAATWTLQDTGLPASAYRVASLLTVNSLWFAAVGTGSEGGIAESIDDGVTWTESAHTTSSSSPPVFDGGNLPGQMGQPRATGDLLATDGTYLYAASFGDGLERWSTASSSLTGGWQCIALCTSFFNSMTLDGKGDAFVSAISRTGQSKGVYEVTGLSPGARAKALSAKNGISTGVQELADVGSRVYAAGVNGIGYLSGTRWLSLDTSSHWYTLTGYEDASGSTPVDVLYASTYAGRGASDVERLIVRGTAASITGLVPGGSVGTDIYGTTTPWWEATSAGGAGHNYGPAAMIGGCPSSSSPLCTGYSSDAFTGSSIVMLTHNGSATDALLVAGRSGIWRYAPSATPEWLPSVNGLATTFNLDVAVDPADNANVAVANSDWNVIVSLDDLRDIDDSVKPPAFLSTSSTGSAVAWDASVSPSAIMVTGASAGKNAQGSIWYDAAWANGGPFSPLPLPAGVSTRPISLASAVISPGVFVLVAAFQRTGVYAFVGSGTVGSWTLIAAGGSGGPTVSPNDPFGVSLTWAADDSAVFMYDRGTHAVWQSGFSAGVFAPWTELYSDTGLTPGRGWVVADPNIPTSVWVANGNGLGVINTATCSSSCSPTWIAGGAGGPLAAAATPTGDFVYMAGEGASPTFWEVQVTQCASTCPEAVGSVDPYYTQLANAAVSLAVGADGGIYVATRGNGVAVASA
jgi:hypothetical protein